MKRILPILMVTCILLASAAFTRPFQLESKQTRVEPAGPVPVDARGVAEELSAARDYPQVNFAAVKEMHRQVGDLQVKNGLATRGLLIRHLILPEDLAGSRKIIDFLASEISPRTTINIMDQYHPCYQAHLHAQINRRPTRDEIVAPRRYAVARGLNVLD